MSQTATKNWNPTSSLLQAGVFWACMAAAGFSTSVLAENKTPVATPPAPLASVAAGPSEFALVTPIHAKETVLVSPDGKEHHVWPSEYEAASGARLLPDGSILRVADSDKELPFQASGLRGGRVQRIAWNGEVLWDFWNAGTFSMASGEALMLPNGNVLMATVERVGQEDAVKAGRDRDRVTAMGLYLPGLLEVSPRGKDKGRIVWKWSAWDHVFQDYNPHLANYDAKREQYRRLDINSFAGKNGLASVKLAYDETSDLILLTLPTVGEFWLLDHGTTTKEATTESGGKRQAGGGILWKWSPATIMPNLPRALSADFIAQQDRAPTSLPSIVVLALHGPKSEKVMRMSMKQVTLKGGDFVSPVGRAAWETLQQWEVPFQTTFDLPNNISLAAAPGVLLLSRTGAGEVNRTEINRPTVASWTHQSLRGAAERKVKVGYVEAPCCGQTVIGEPLPPDTRPTVTVKVSRIGTPRYYAKEHLGAFSPPADATVSPAAAN